MKSNKIIAIEGATRIELAKLFKVTDKTVFNALSFKSSTSGVQRRIRKAAMERGGRLLVDLTGLETFHDFDGQYAVQPVPALCIGIPGLRHDHPGVPLQCYRPEVLSADQGEDGVHPGRGRGHQGQGHAG